VHEQKQRVVDTGPYAVVRHPMYAGAAMLIVGLPLWLGSIAATLVALAPIAVVALRAVFEEQFLRRELAGYEDYMRRVRWRLVPRVW
jgi:protein-S-isoprenylcysteine O-methyltransferase Ste14